MFPDGGKAGDVKTVHLGQYTDDNASAISEKLHEAAIHHWWKTTGRFARVMFGGDWGTHLFVDAARLEEAQQLASEISG